MLSHLYNVTLAAILPGLNLSAVFCGCNCGLGTMFVLTSIWAMLPEPAFIDSGVEIYERERERQRLRERKRQRGILISYLYITIRIQPSLSLNCIMNNIIYHISIKFATLSPLVLVPIVSSTPTITAMECVYVWGLEREEKKNSMYWFLCLLAS